jgi:hypothetical protein
MPHFTLNALELYGLLAIFSYAVNTAPVPDNKWAKWLMGVIQFAMLNWNKAQQHFDGSAPVEDNKKNAAAGL